ncbi:MAG: hypothetical protein KGL18_16160 [Burkholderiales bacterium]|nr:hypothetical protein [Burkholderiales bacterium]MDE1926611.1 hypothetical protein [Burkholderiales bacterium]MDE2158845.1 hypothetical protein [Burkholderiales bacterium]MDE2504499.1 hypothetical protein [Burkholderiales bacterium]
MLKTITPWLAIAGAGLLLAACADLPRSTQALLTYETVPAGAELFEGGKDLGMAPVTRTYKSDGKSTSITTPDVTAVWASGAKTSYFTILNVGDDRVATLQRPASAPGLQADLDKAKTVAATSKAVAERVKRDQMSEMARMSARCQAQMAKGGNPATDDCR